MKRSIIVAACHLAVLMVPVGMHLRERATQPTVWVRAKLADSTFFASKGSQAWLILELRAVGLEPHGSNNLHGAALSIENGELVARATPHDRGVLVVGPTSTSPAATLLNPLEFSVPDASALRRLTPGEELIAELRIPPKGSPRPVRAGIRHGGAIRPLEP